MAHAGLRRQMNDAVDRWKFAASFSMPSRSAISSLRKVKFFSAVSRVQPRFFQRHIVIVVEIVDADDSVAARQQARAKRWSR